MVGKRPEVVERVVPCAVTACPDFDRAVRRACSDETVAEPYGLDRLRVRPIVVLQNARLAGEDMPHCDAAALMDAHEHVVGGHGIQLYRTDFGAIFTTEQ